MKCLAIATTTGAPCGVNPVRNAVSRLGLLFCRTHQPADTSEALSMATERIWYEVRRGKKYFLLGILAGTVLALYLTPILTWHFGLWGGETLELKPAEFVSLFFWPIPLLGILAWRLGWLARIRLPRPRLPRPSRTTILITVVILQTIALGWFVWKLFGDDVTGWFVTHRTTILAAIGTLVCTITIPLVLLTRSWWRKPATKEDWRRWKENHEDRWWFKAAQHRRLILAGIAIPASLIFAWSNRPWGLLAVIAAGYGLLWTKTQAAPGPNFGSGIPDADVFRDPNGNHEPVRCRVMWTGFIPLGLARSPIFAIPGLVWFLLTISGLLTVTELTIKVISFTVWGVSPWLAAGGVLDIYWLKWAAGPWRRNGFFLNRLGIIYQCLPKKTPFWRPLETEIATIAIGRVAHWSGSRGPLGGYTFDPGFELAGPAGRGERVAGRFIPGWFIQACERLASRFGH